MYKQYVQQLTSKIRFLQISQTEVKMAGFLKIVLLVTIFAYVINGQAMFQPGKIKKKTLLKSQSVFLNIILYSEDLTFWELFIPPNNI